MDDLIAFEIDTESEKELKGVTNKKIGFVEVAIPGQNVNDFLVQVTIYGPSSGTPITKWFLHPKISPMQQDTSHAIISNSIPINVLHGYKLCLKLFSDVIKSPVEGVVCYKIY